MQKPKAIICTGRSSHPKQPQTGEIGRRLLLSLGVPDEAIVVAGGEDTQGEMKSVRELLNDPPPALRHQGKIGLITSAFHMNRALRMANASSLEFVPIPVAFRMDKMRPLSANQLIPTAEAGNLFRAALKETLAKILGK